VEDCVVEVEDMDWVGDELSGVPVVVCREDGGFGFGVDTEDVCRRPIIGDICGEDLEREI
jgi:hypothetical protein